MSEPVALTVIVAVQHAQDNLPAILKALDTPGHPAVEFLLCHTDADPRVAALPAGNDNLRVLRSPAGSLIPHLWRNGIEAARGARVALTTAHCIPSPDWVARLGMADLETYAAVGGTIAGATESDARGWAILLLRYVAFFPPQAPREVQEIAADNAVYRRSAILRHRDLLAEGFWEPSFHARFRRDGLRIGLDPALQVFHRNRYGAAQFAAQRLSHGWAFGLERALTWTFARRATMLAAMPAVPAILFWRILRAAIAKPQLRRQLPGAVTWLVFFLLCWSAGEMLGTAASLGIARHRASMKGALDA